MHDFDKSLELSHSADSLPLWEECYRSAFPGFQSMVNHRQDGEHQRAGIDRSVILSNSKQLLVDEKIRFKNKKTGKVYDDIALEYYSDEARQTPGWTWKPLLCDYIAYAIAPLGICYLLPVPQLQAAWIKHGTNWIDMYPRIAARNITGMNQVYTTVSVGVPADVVMKAISDAFRVGFTPVDNT